MKNILVTGGCGKIGSYFIKHAEDKYKIRVSDLPGCTINGNVEIIKGDLKNYDYCLNITKDIDTVIHLAANPSPDQNFEEVLTNNIIPTYNIYKAACENNCNRVIFASSAQTIESYPNDVQIGIENQVRPKNLYGVSKCFGEALASFFAFNKNLSSICLRIGAYEFPEDHDSMNLRDLSAFLHPDDMNQLLIACIEAKEITFKIFNAISDNTFKRLDITQTIEQIDYGPVNNAFETFSVLLDKQD